MGEVTVRDGVAMLTVSKRSIKEYGGVPIPIPLLTDTSVRLIRVLSVLEGIEYTMERTSALRYGFRSALNEQLYIVPCRHWEQRSVHEEQLALF